MPPVTNKAISIVTVTFALFPLTGLIRVGMAQSAMDSSQPDSTVQTSVLEPTRATLEEGESTIRGYKRRYEKKKSKTKSALKRRQERRTASLIDSLRALNCDCTEVAQEAVRAVFARKWHLKNVKMRAKLVGRMLKQRRKIVRSPVAEYLKGNAESLLRDEDALREAQATVKELVRYIEKLEERSEARQEKQMVPEGVPGERKRWNTTGVLKGKVDSAKAALEEARHKAGMIRSERKLNGAVRSVSIDVFIRASKLMADARNRWDSVVDHFKKAQRLKQESRRKRQLLQTRAQDVEDGRGGNIEVTTDNEAEEY